MTLSSGPGWHRPPAVGLTRCPACHGRLAEGQRFACSPVCLAVLDEALEAHQAFALDPADEVARVRHNRAEAAVVALRPKRPEVSSPKIKEPDQ